MTPYLTTSPKPAIFARRQGFQRGDVDQYAQRLEEGPDHVLRLGQIDADLAAHGTIDLGQERGGNLQEADAPGVGGGDEAGQVADHAAADRDDHRLAVGVQLEHALPEPGGHVERLRRFARLDGHDVDSTFRPARLSATRMACGCCDVLVGDDDGVRLGGQEGAGLAVAAVECPFFDEGAISFDGNSA